MQPTSPGLEEIDCTAIVPYDAGAPLAPSDGPVRARTPSPTVDQLFCTMTTMLDDETGAHARALRQARALSRDPKVHECGDACPYREMNPDKTFCCSISGVCFGQQTCWDALAAGIVTGLDENGVRTCGRSTQPRRPHRRDLHGASQSAMLAAAAFDETEEVDGWTPAPRKRRATVGCDPDGHTSKVIRRTPCEIEGDQMLVLRREAKETLDKLTTPKARAGAPSAPPLNGSTALHEALHSYIRRCQIAGCLPTLDDVHNIELNCRRDMVVARRRDAAHRKATFRSAEYMQLREFAATLAVALWRCALRTPYMRQAKRSVDNFRPFAAGVFFSMRRGVLLADGTSLVPRCAKLTDALPEVRAAHRGTVTHAVHLSAHKGVSTMQGCIKSVEKESATEFFAEAVCAAEMLERVMTKHRIGEQ